jgi:hypothetical protein
MLVASSTLPMSAAPRACMIRPSLAVSTTMATTAAAQVAEAAISPSVAPASTQPPASRGSPRNGSGVTRSNSTPATITAPGIHRTLMADHGVCIWAIQR